MEIVEKILVSFLHILLILLFLECLFQTSNGLKLRLIHLDSPESPLYMSNLTHGERIQRLVTLSQARVDNLESLGSTNTTIETAQHIIEPQYMRPQVRVEGLSVYMVLINIGTFSEGPHKSYYLNMDTGRQLTWLQCSSCKEHYCFPQSEPPFPNHLSTSYKTLPCGNHDLCYSGQCLGASCSYKLPGTRGILGNDSLTLSSGYGMYEMVQGFVFGCGIDNPTSFPSELIAGQFGLGWGPRTFVLQTKAQTRGQFSYCLQHIQQQHEGPHSELHFGADIVPKQGFAYTALRRYQGKEYYYVNLEGISVGNVRVDIPAESFRVRSDYSGGTIIDTSSAFSHLIRVAYDRLHVALDAYFAPLENYRRATKVYRGFDICYVKNRWLGYPDQRPTITFHFEGGANLRAVPKSAFIKTPGEWTKTFCLAMLPSDTMTTLGAYQQANTRFIYDLMESKLFFQPADCRV